MSIFGAKTGFGSAFGTQNSTFGTSTPFGQSSTGFGTPSAFGAQTPASGGLFGSTGTTTNTGGLFGQASTSTFGQPAASGGGFGFGVTPSTSSNLFGQTTQASSLFSTPASNTAFGAKTPAFGSNTASTNLFGTQQNAGGSLFGASGGLFGGSTPATNGTTVKFNAPQGTDTMVKNGVSQNISTRHQCITAMKEYENKSLEELRMEDYASNRKGKQQSSLFGSTGPTTQTTAFGFNQNKPAGFGTTGGFGTQTSAAGGGLFGNTQTASSAGGLFGQNKSLFGTSTTGFGMGQTQPSTSVFGQNQQQNKTLFGTNPTTQTGGLFGNTNTSTFGTAGFGGFGTTSQPSTGGLFSKPAFGTATTTTASAFNLGGQSTGGIFGKPATTGAFSFGATSTAPTGFGVQTNPGLFGNKPATGFGTGTTGLTGSTFGTGFNAGNTSLFGSNQAKAPFNFGSGTNTGFGTGSLGLGTGLAGNTNTTFSFGNTTSNIGSNTTDTATAQNAQIQQQLMALTNSPYGDSPLFWNLKQGGANREEVLKPTNPAAQKAVLNSSSQYKVSPRPTAKIKPKSLHSLMNGSKSQIFDGLGEEEDFSFGSDPLVRRKSVKKLVIKNHGNGSVSSGNQVSQTEDFTEQRQFSEEPELPPINSYDSPHTVHMASMNGETEGRSRPVAEVLQPPGTAIRPETPQKRLEFNETIIGHEENAHEGSVIVTPSSRNRSQLQGGDDTQPEQQIHQDLELIPPHPAGVVLTRPGYYCVPSLQDLAALWRETSECLVENFTIGREGFGSIFFPGVTDVAGLNLDEIVHFRRKEVIVYPEDESKPPLGEGLNKRAEVTLDCVWPNDKVTKSPVKSPQKLRVMNYQDKIELATAKLGAKFVDYRPETGSWVFEVKHFSKYGLLEDSDDEEMSEQDKKKLKLLQQKNLAIQKQKLAMVNGKPGPELIDVELRREGEALRPDPSLGEAVIPRDFTAGDAMQPREDTPMMDEDDFVTRGEYPESAYIPTEEGEVEYMSGGEEPSSHRLATSMGVNARRMQIMKASFFSEENTTDHVPVAELAHPVMSDTRPASPLLRKTEPLVRHTSLFGAALKSKYQPPTRRESKIPSGDHHMEAEGFRGRSPSVESLKPVQAFFSPPPEHIPIPSGMTQERPRRIVGSRIQRELPAASDSFLFGKERLLHDSGCYMGRSFRVGWGPGWTLVHSGQPSYVQETSEKPAPLALLHGQKSVQSPRLGGSPWVVTMETVNVDGYFSSQDQLVLANHRHALEVQLEHALSEEEEGTPAFRLSPGPVALHQFSLRTHKDLELSVSHPEYENLAQMDRVYSLCVALWGNLPGYDSQAMNEVDTNSYSYHQSRRDAVSRWLSEVCGKTLTEETDRTRFKSESHLKVVLSMLSARKIKEACSLAQKSGDHRLALLLAQVVGNHVPRQMIAQQLANWCELKADQFIDTERLKIYLLLSGQLLWLASNRMVNVCDNMDWKKSFAFHLWFRCPPSALVCEAVSLYDAAYRGSETSDAYAVSPRPPYLEADPTEADEEKQFTIHDTCYHLLRLYCDRSHGLERLLVPVSSTPNQLDYRLSWHLCQVLQSLGYFHLSEYHLSLIHISYAAQLESLGLWHWAVFVLLHITDSYRRRKSVQALLCRHIRLTDDSETREVEKLLVDRFHVPKEWVHEAKALRARYVGESHAEAWHLLKARRWDESHRVVLREIAADAIINENYDYLRQYLEELVPEKGGLIENWQTGGSVFLDYINLCQQLDVLSQGEPSVFELERLQPEVISLCNRVGRLDCPTAKHRLCQCEMAKKAANLLRTLITLQKDTPPDHVPVRLLAPHISHLPMPEDYSMQELRQLTRSYMLEMNCS